MIRRLNASGKDECIVDNGNDLNKIVNRMEAAISIMKKVFGKQVPFSLAIVATKVPQLLEVSHRYKSIIGGEYLNHVIEIEGKTKGQINLLLDGISSKDLDNNILSKINNATKVKVCVISFQLSLPGMPHTEVIATRSQSNNELNDFIIDMERASARAMHSTGVHPTSFLNYAVDGVSCECRHVLKSNCDFL